MDNELTLVGRHLAQNLLQLRQKLGFTQNQVAKLANIPRSTLTNLESGTGNPSLANLFRLSKALKVSIEELLDRPHAEVFLLKKADIKQIKKSQGATIVSKLLPHKIPGLEFDKLELSPGYRMVGSPHLAKTREYLVTMQGQVEVTVAGQRYLVGEGDVLNFPGDEPHSYFNPGSKKSVSISVVWI